MTEHVRLFYLYERAYEVIFIVLFFSDKEDDLFSSFSATKAKPSKPSSKPSSATPKPQASNHVPSDDDDDDLFSDPLSGGASTSSKTAPSQVTKTVSKKPEVSKSEKKEPDVLFGSPQKSESDHDLFASISKPAVKTKASVPVTIAEQRPSPKVTKKTPAKKSSGGGLFGESEEDDDDLFSDSTPAKSKPSEPKTPAPQKEASPVAKKKPAGAVSLFGGADILGDKGLKSPDKKDPPASSSIAKRQEDLFGEPISVVIVVVAVVVVVVYLFTYLCLFTCLCLFSSLWCLWKKPRG